MPTISAHRNRASPIARLLLVVALGSAVLGGCSSAADALRRYRVSYEPGRVVLRNASDRAADFIAVREVEGSEGSVRLGRIQPALVGSEVAFERRENPEPFPREVLVVWRERGAPERSQQISLGPVLSRATGRSGERLVFEVHDDSATAYLDTGSGTPRY